MEKILQKALKTYLPRSVSHQSRKNLPLRKKTINKKEENKCTCDNKVDCICKCTNILIRPSQFEETCFIFDEAENLYGVDSKILLSLQKLVTEIYYPFTKQYDFYRLNFNHRFNFYPVAIVRAHTVEDIVSTINFCRAYKIPLRARGGAHAYQPASLINFGIVIDQRSRDAIVKINHQKKTVQIQAGALLGPSVTKLSSGNLLLPTGTCTTNGLAGLTLGGGIGFSRREYGLTMDSVVNIKVVLADGSVVKANNSKNSDLFWALKGAGGGNFGVVTDFTFKVYPMQWVTIFTLNYNFSDTKKILKAWQKWAPFTNTKLTSELDIHNRFQPVIVTGQLLADSDKISDQKLLLKLIKPLLDLGIHTDLSIKTVALKESYEYFAEGSYARPLFFYNQSYFNFDMLSDEAMDTIIYHMGLLDESQSYHKTEIDALGGNFSKIPSDATAFPSRSAIHWLQFTSLWTVQEQEKSNVKWLSNYYSAMRKFFPLNRKYVNALDYDVPRLSALKSYYGPNLLKLIKIKHKYDPTNFFNFEQSIPELDYFD